MSDTHNTTPSEAPEAPETDDLEQRYIDVFASIAAAVTALSETQTLMARDLANLRGMMISPGGDAA